MLNRALLVAFVAVAAAGASAQILPIGLVTGGTTYGPYLPSTTLIDFSGVGDGAVGNVLTDGVESITFSDTMTKQTVPTGWATWNSFPFVENSTPPVLTDVGSSSLTMMLSLATPIFGFEAEPNDFGLHSMSASFYSGGTLLGTITSNVVGNSGAQLFAAESLSTPIDEVIFNVDQAAAGFAIAAPRYRGAVPEPTSMLALAGGVVALIRRRRNSR